ncbi:15772_t:CDS:2 [Acaulospora colombiana]|uniref:15772_t:CDS:1 n=1 Tax=Acaulospora colombiana TaxID=27376 RepID=A0ACA9MJX7_9GLOM|nr:15772_t:CDS:2 [Acaulospora colombiana]
MQVLSSRESQMGARSASLRPQPLTNAHVDAGGLYKRVAELRSIMTCKKASRCVRLDGGIEMERNAPNLVELVVFEREAHENALGAVPAASSMSQPCKLFLFVIAHPCRRAFGRTSAQEETEKLHKEGERKGAEKSEDNCSIRPEETRVGFLSFKLRDTSDPATPPPQDGPSTACSSPAQTSFAALLVTTDDTSAVGLKLGLPTQLSPSSRSASQKCIERPIQSDKSVDMKRVFVLMDPRGGVEAGEECWEQQSAVLYPTISAHFRPTGARTDKHGYLSLSAEKLRRVSTWYTSRRIICSDEQSCKTGLRRAGTRGGGPILRWWSCWITGISELEA